MVFNSVTEAAVLIFPTLYAMSGGLLLQWALGYNFSVAVWVGYIALFGIAVETGVVMVVYLHEALENRLQIGQPLTEADLEASHHRRRRAALASQADDRTAVLLSLAPDPLGIRHRFGRDEADRRADRRRHDYLHYSRADSRPGLFPADETARIARRPSSSRFIQSAG